MHKLTKVCILTALSFISAQSMYASYPANSGYGGNPYYRQGQGPYDQSASQYTPEMSGENEFMMQSRNRFNQMNQTNRNMIQQDQRMIKEGYDPNENYPDAANRAQNQYDPNNPYRNQEQMMRGGAPSYPLDDNYPNTSRNNPRQRFNAPPQGYDPGYNPGYNPGYSPGYNNKTSYRSPSPDDSGKYIGDSTNDMPSPSRMTRGTASTNPNTNWDTTDDQAIQRSSSNTSRSSPTTGQNIQR